MSLQVFPRSWANLQMMWVARPTQLHVILACQSIQMLYMLANAQLLASRYDILFRLPFLITLDGGAFVKFVHRGHWMQDLLLNYAGS